MLRRKGFSGRFHAPLKFRSHPLLHRRHRVVAFDLLDEVGEVAGPEGEVADDQCVHNNPDRPHVPGLADLAAVRLGGHEGRCPSGVDHDVGGVVDDGVGDTKVADLDDPVIPE